MSVNSPVSLFSSPFAQGGDKANIPAFNAGSGRASLNDGFPIETQMPVEAGGVPPNRLDFNGILHMMSSFLWWMQSGGQWEWRSSLDYAAPAMVFRNGRTYLAQADSGPGTPNGPVDPVLDAECACWKQSLAGIGADGETLIINENGQLQTRRGLGVPVGGVLPYYGLSAPDGFFLCNGAVFSQTAYPELAEVLGGTTLPDLRGEFLRFLDMGRGVDADRVLGSSQTDAARNLTGGLRAFGASGGAFYNAAHVSYWGGWFQRNL